VVQNPSILNISISASGICSVKVTDANNCQGNDQTEVKISPILGNETPKGADINIYPNPVGEQLNVTFDAEPNKQINITILDNRGRVIEQRKLKATGGNQQVKFDIRNMTSGQYLLKINTSQQELVKKIVISQ
jgi:predicted YcjX-like family ATPase